MEPIPKDSVAQFWAPYRTSVLETNFNRIQCPDMQNSRTPDSQKTKPMVVNKTLKVEVPELYMNRTKVLMGVETIGLLGF